MERAKYKYKHKKTMELKLQPPIPPKSRQTHMNIHKHT